MMKTDQSQKHEALLTLVAVFIIHVFVCVVLSLFMSFVCVAWGHEAVFINHFFSHMF